MIFITMIFYNLGMREHPGQNSRPVVKSLIHKIEIIMRRFVSFCNWHANIVKSALRGHPTER